MHFCTVCSNMYYHKIDPETNALSYFCKKCGNEDKIISEQNVCVSKYSSNETSSFSNFINAYTKYDPTLPHSTTIPCPNEKCRSNGHIEATEATDVAKATGNLRDVIYIRYDDTNMNYMYICCVCDTVWKLK